MKRICRLGISLLLLLVLLTGCCSAALGEKSGQTREELGYTPKKDMLEGTRIKWNDPAFDDLFISYMLPEQLTTKEYETIFLNNAKHPVKDLSGLQFFTALKRLQITSNQVENLNVLPTIKKLEVLVFENANAIDLEPLTQCKNLKRVQFQNCAKLNLEPLTRCKKLEGINLIGENITDEDLSYIGQIKKLNELGLNGTTITNLDALENMKSLRSLTLLNKSPLKNCAGLSSQRKLKKLWLQGVDAKTVASVLETNRKTLSDLAIVDMDIDSAIQEAIRGCTKLENLTFESMKIEKWPTDLLSKAKKLNELIIRTSQIDNLEWMAPSVQRLRLSQCEMQSARGLSGLEKLEMLMIYACKVPDFSFLNNLGNAEKIKGILIDGSKLQDVSFAANYPKLLELYLEGNEIEDISPLAATNIRTLSIYDNPVKDCSPLQNMKGLFILYYDENQPVSRIEGLNLARRHAPTDFRQLYADTFEANAANPPMAQ